MSTRLDISIGPVQGFVSQSRRTRDLWGSSYLLAFLSAHAMRGAKEAGGKIVQPKVDNDLLFKWVCEEREGDPPRIGTLPNHFVVETDGDPRPIAEAATDSLRVAWERVCNAVWGSFVEHAASDGNGTKDIWDRQVCGFWEVTWTAGPSDNGGGGLLARRKHWRSHRPPDEPGDKCSIMHDLQELSGFIRAQDRAKQDKFWKRIRREIGGLNLRDNERLCAIALVKRMFPGVAEDALGWNVDASHWPSTVYIAAVPWIRRVVSAAPGPARKYAEAVRQSAAEDVFPMQSPPFDCLLAPEAGAFPKLDANYMHSDFVLDERLSPLKEGVGQERRRKLACALKRIHDTKDAQGTLGPPSSFYALLLADGDRLGKLVGAAGGDVVSKALTKFTDRVPKVVSGHDGVPIYAGGDDVLAMVSVPRVLTCADEISEAYKNAFTGVSDEATLSAAVVFAHARLPLSSVLREAHHMLDDVAKDGNGRNSLAVSVLKPAGKHCQWVTTWTRRGPSGEDRAVALLDQLKSALNHNAAEPGLSSSLVYRIRDTLSMLCGWDRWRPGEWGAVPKGIKIKPFLQAEIFRSLDIRMDERAAKRAESLASRVVSLLSPARNPQPTEGGGGITEAGIDALLLARFLADPDDQETYR